MRLGKSLLKSVNPATLFGRENVHPSYLKNAHFRKPIVATRGEGQWIYDDHSGKKYLDFFGGIVTVGVGHCHPKVNDALIQQAKKLWHTTSIYITEPVGEYASKLVSTLPGNLKVVYPVNSGSEANDLALIMARVATGNVDIIALRNGYHGMSPVTMGITGLSNWKQHMPYTGSHHVMCPNPYTGIWGGKNCRDSAVQVDRPCDCTPGVCKATDKYIDQIEELLAYTIPQKKVAGLFVESIQGVGGVVQFTNGYIKKAFELVRANGGLCISDEVQSGFGRTGDHMWHFQAHDVIPDIVTMAKSIGNGFPLAAVVTTPEIAEKVTAVHHFNTFAGNPLASVVGKAVLEVIEEEGLQANCKEIGTYLLLELKKFRDTYEFVGDVRGKGLMLGIEMVESKESKRPLRTEMMTEIFEELKDEGLLVGRGGYAGNVFRIAPPMCITKNDADMALDIMNRVLKKHANNTKN